ncbi:uncharacterized protein LOC135490620 isoform X2 [Lineus longissimus]
MKQGKENNLGVHSMCYNGTNFFHGFSATTIDFNQQTTVKHVIFFPCEQLLVTNTSDPDNWTAVSATNPERYGVISRRLLRMTELRQEPWFYPELSQATAISLLRRQGPGSFLVRTHKKKHLISFMTERNVHHTWIHQSESGRYYINNRRRFSTVQELLDYSKRNEVNGMKLDKFPSHRNLEEHWKMDLTKVDMTAHRDVASPFPWHIRMGKNTDDQNVTLMYLKKNATKEDEFWLRRQAKLLMCLQHENIVQLLGVGDSSRRYTVMLQTGGSENLMSYLQSTPTDILLQRPYELLNIAKQICTAMAHLEKRGIVHNELMVDNCWLDRASMTVKLGGFHLARFEEDLQEIPTCYTSKVLINPPEIVDGQTASSMSDVWAYGILLWVLFTGGRHLHSGVKLSKIVNYKWREDLPHPVKDIVDQMMNACLYQIPQIRPTFCDILRQLKTWPLGNDKGGGSVPHRGFDLFELETYEQRFSDTTPAFSVTPTSSINCKAQRPDPYDTESSSVFEENVDFAFQEKYTLQALERRNSMQSTRSCVSPDHDSLDLNSPKADDSFPELFEQPRKHFDESLAVNIDESEHGEDTRESSEYFEFETPQSSSRSLKHGQCLSSDSGVSLHHMPRVDPVVKQEANKFFNAAKKYRHLYKQEKTEKEELEQKVREFEFSCKDKLDVMIVKLSDRIKELELQFDNSQVECKKLRERNKMLARSFCDQCKQRMHSGSRDDSWDFSPRKPECDKVIQTDVSYSDDSFVLDVLIPDDGASPAFHPAMRNKKTNCKLIEDTFSDDSFVISALMSEEEISPMTLRSRPLKHCLPTGRISSGLKTNIADVFKNESQRKPLDPKDFNDTVTSNESFVIDVHIPGEEVDVPLASSPIHPKTVRTVKRGISLPNGHKISMTNPSGTLKGSCVGTVDRVSAQIKMNTVKEQDSENPGVVCDNVSVKAAVTVNGKRAGVALNVTNGVREDKQTADPIKQAIRDMEKENEAHKLKLKQLEIESRKRSRSLSNEKLAASEVKSRKHLEDLDDLTVHMSKTYKQDKPANQTSANVSSESVKSSNSNSSRPVPNFSFQSSSDQNSGHFHSTVSDDVYLSESEGEDDSENVGNQSVLSGVFPIEELISEHCKKEAQQKSKVAIQETGQLASVDLDDGRRDSDGSDTSSEDNFRAAQKLVEDNLKHKYLSNKTHISTFVPNGNHGYNKVTLL